MAERPVYNLIFTIQRTENGSIYNCEVLGLEVLGDGSPLAPMVNQWVKLYREKLTAELGNGNFTIIPKPNVINELGQSCNMIYKSSIYE